MSWARRGRSDRSRGRGGRALAVAALLGAASACGGGGGGGGPLTFDRYGMAIFAGNCKLEVACGMYPDQATCEASLRPQTSLFETMKVDIASGKVVYDAGAAGRCVGMYDMFPSCRHSEIAPIVQQAQDACDKVFEGTVAAGGDCFFGQECASGSCSTTCAQSCCPGTCMAVPAPIPMGGDCSALQPLQSCAYGTRCLVDPQTGGRTCLPPTDTEGAACTTMASGCDGSLYCDADAITGVGTCKRWPATGAACNPASGCDDGRDACDPTTALCARSTPPGAACDPTKNWNCVAYAGCSSATSTCQAASSLGETCDGATGYGCLAGLACDATTSTCVSSNPPGPACM